MKVVWPKQAAAGMPSALPEVAPSYHQTALPNIACTTVSFMCSKCVHILTRFCVAMKTAEPISSDLSIHGHQLFLELMPHIIGTKGNKKVIGFFF